MGQTSLSVGPPYFRPTFLLAIVPLLLLLSLGIHANWKRGRLAEAVKPLAVAAAVAVLLGAAAVFGLYGGRHALAITGFGIGGWIILSSLLDPVDRLRRHLSLSRAVLGMTLAHIGLGVAVIALTSVESYTAERDIALSRGASADVGGYEFKLLGTQALEGPNYSTTRATVAVSRDGRMITTLYPEVRQFWVQQQTRKVAGIYNLHGTDLFIALGDDLGAGRWSLRAQIRPLITLLWLGPLLMALGGALALSDRRYRLARATARAGTAGGARRGALKLRFLVPLGVFVLLVGVLIVGLNHSREVGVLQSPLVGHRIPDWELPVLTDPGRSLSSRQLRGQWYVPEFLGLPGVMPAARSIRCCCRPSATRACRSSASTGRMRIPRMRWRGCRNSAIRIRRWWPTGPARRPSTSESRPLRNPSWSIPMG